MLGQELSDPNGIAGTAGSYEGYVTVHQSATEGETPHESARRTADYLQPLLKIDGAC